MVKAYAAELALSGVEVPGYKLVEGRSSRAYALDDGTIMQMLLKADYAQEEITVTKLRTVADMEKTIGKAAFNELLAAAVVKTPGAPTLVPITDKRPAINSAAAAKEDFANVVND